MTRTRVDVAVIGGGIVGLATARALLAARRRSLIVLEAEPGVGRHQTGRNSGVIHSGLYYRPESEKAALCTAGREELYRFCDERGLAFGRCGKVVVAVEPRELTALDELERRGRTNGLRGLERLDAAGLRRHEPRCVGLAGLWVAEAGVVDFGAVAAALAAAVREQGGEVRTAARVRGIERDAGGLTLRLAGERLSARFVVNCAGLQADRVARLAGLRPGLRIVPFRGDYHRLAADREAWVRHLIYSVPDLRLPFLGAHFTRRVDGTVEVGPSALLALAREGYGPLAFSARDALAVFSYAGFWRMAARHWQSGLGEIRRALDRRVLARDLARRVPGLTARDLVPAGRGIRAQAVAPDGALLDDFRIVEAERMLHVLNAPSPAATAALAIGRRLARRVERA